MDQKTLSDIMEQQPATSCATAGCIPTNARQGLTF